jgi:hypothetical protein
MRSRSLRRPSETAKRRRHARPGDALHEIEDYFSHSNFTEVALATLAQAGDSAAQVVLDAAQREDGVNPATAGAKDPFGRPQIITGTYGDESGGANQMMSLIETLKTEVLTGALTLAFIKGSARVGGKDVGAAGRWALGGVGGAAMGGGGAVGEGLAGGAGGAWRGLEQGYREGRGWRALGSMATGMFSGGWHGLISGAEQGASTGFETGEKVGGSIGDVVGTATGDLVIGGLAAALALPLFEALDQAVKVELDMRLSEVEKRRSAVGAPADPDTKVAGPTHSQLAKDSLDHPVFELSRALAVEADRQIGLEMKHAWRTADKGAAVKPVHALVEKFVSHPSSDDWWQGVLTPRLSILGLWLCESNVAAGR